MANTYWVIKHTQFDKYFGFDVAQLTLKSPTACYDWYVWEKSDNITRFSRRFDASVVASIMLPNMEAYMEFCEVSDDKLSFFRNSDLSDLQDKIVRKEHACFNKDTGEIVIGDGFTLFQNLPKFKII